MLVGVSSLGEEMTTHFSLMQSLMSGSVPPLTYTPSRCAQGQLYLLFYLTPFFPDFMTGFPLYLQFPN